jgi:hypothetical protein
VTQYNCLGNGQVHVPPPVSKGQSIAPESFNLILVIIMRRTGGEQRVVNGSQSKFLEETWRISQIKSDVSLFYLGQDHLAIGQLSVLETGLETAAKTQNDASKTLCEHLVGAFEKQPFKSN